MSWKLNKQWKTDFAEQLKKPFNFMDVFLGKTINCYYSDNKGMAKMVLSSFAIGCNGIMFDTSYILKPFPGISVSFGKENISNIVRPCLKQRKELIYIDHAYFDRGYKGKGHEHNNPPNFRIIRNGIHHTKILKRPHDRFLKFDIKLKPWRAGNPEQHILICPPTGFLETMVGSKFNWFETVMKTIRDNTDRKIVIRPKPGITNIDSSINMLERYKNIELSRERTLAEDLENCWAAVAPASNVLVEALKEGVPVFSEKYSPVVGACSHDYSRIESPLFLERDELFYSLAYSQFSLDEIKDGTAWKILMEQS